MDERRAVEFLKKGLNPGQVAAIVGVSPGRISQLLSKEEVIELIKKHYQEYGSIKTSDFRHVAQVVRCFGSWRNGMEEVLGFSNVTRYTKEEIIEFMKKHYKENGNIKSKDFKYKKQVTRYFGSWENAIKVIF